ncbi:uncharacterized protein V2V93DRAFT_372029 [Kockiozyma suomiensis]|uniref:uncharacterized protein n=1 Tax=Kockiozyma suomiensis TaxID=1337062 RepID=UPI0033441DA8
MSYEAYMYNLHNRRQRQVSSSPMLFSYFDEEYTTRDEYYSKSSCVPPPTGTVRYSSYAGFAMPPSLCFEGGSKSFGEYMRYFCKKLAARENTKSSVLDEEIDAIMRERCSGALLRSMALVEMRNPTYYLYGVEYGSSGGWRSSAAILKCENKWRNVEKVTGAAIGRRRVGKGKKDLVRGKMVSFTADRNYIWQRRAEMILCPAMTIKEEDENYISNELFVDGRLVWDYADDQSDTTTVSEKFGEFVQSTLELGEVDLDLLY